MALLADHAAWVAARLAALPGAIRFTDGACVPLDGVPTPIRHVPGDAAGPGWRRAKSGSRAGPSSCPAASPPSCTPKRGGGSAVQAAAKAESIGLRPRRITVKDTRSRWGSCGPDGTLMFCWRLVMAPPHVQDYVVAHEVAHLRHLDHGKQFWVAGGGTDAAHQNRDRMAAP